MQLQNAGIDTYIVFRFEEALFLPPRIPRGLNEFRAVSIGQLTRNVFLFTSRCINCVDCRFLNLFHRFLLQNARVATK